MYDQNRCFFCNKQNDFILENSVLVNLILYKFGMLGRIAHNITKCFNDFPEITLGSETIYLSIPRCKTCKHKHENISFFDFNTKKEAENIIKRKIVLYTDNGYRIELILIDKMASCMHDIIKGAYSVLIPKLELSETKKFSKLISLIASVLKFYDYSNNESMNLLIRYMTNNLNIPEHELFIIFNYFKSQFDTINDYEALLEDIVKDNLEKNILIDTLNFLASLIEINKIHIRERMKFILLLEEILNVRSDILNQYRANTSNTLSVEELIELKKIYRKAAKMCHPDTASEELKSSSHDFMSDLNQAYHKMDLIRVRSIYEKILSFHL